MPGLTSLSATPVQAQTAPSQSSSSGMIAYEYPSDTFIDLFPSLSSLCQSLSPLECDFVHWPGQVLWISKKHCLPLDPCMFSLWIDSSSGALVGIIVGCVVGGIVLLIIVVLVVRYGRLRLVSRLTCQEACRCLIEPAGPSCKLWLRQSYLRVASLGLRHALFRPWAELRGRFVSRQLWNLRFGVFSCF